ncbi:tRNA (N(6)-L-threonylcarbamoyladenosine(37)-C(2))-methylthiotransferase MtaB [Eubacteriales bacterium OttesenSCG-928-A19]|nr:tRNA (N(6)-L-threonylcarbamoyladenosine(37)-C(2))-methylthiotransferase MtaB [Eubacteriales bacterium OttesenSCG-928-A19]
MPRTVAFCTLGCKVNQYDSQAMLEAFERAGYVAAPFADVADVYVVNTCTVTGTGDKKSRQMIRRAARRNPEAAIVVTGCMAQRAAESLLLEGVMLVLGTQRRGEIVTLLEGALAKGEPLIAVEPLAGDIAFEPLSVRRSEGRTRATLKIQEGCGCRCTYCIIPSVRGPVRSRPLTEIAAEARRLAEQGYQEIVVAGIHLSSYGMDLAEKATLRDALRVLQATEGVRRIRLGSLEPGIVTEDFVRGLAALDKLCPQFMLALQSGSDAVLARMGRRYRVSRYEAAVNALRAQYPDAALTTDLMTGFPGETDAEFDETMAFVERIGFARVHVFPYSRREGTPAADMPGQVPHAVGEGRAQRLIALGDTLARRYMERWIGRTRPVLFEEKAGLGATGYTPEYVHVVADGTPGRIQNVRLTEMTVAREPALRGKVESKA